MEFQIIDFAEEKQSLFLFSHQFDPSDPRSQRAWISTVLVLHHTGISISGNKRSLTVTHTGEACVKMRSFIPRISFVFFENLHLLLFHAFLFGFYPLFVWCSLAHTVASICF